MGAKSGMLGMTDTEVSLVWRFNKLFSRNFLA